MEAYITKGFMSLKRKWRFKYGRGVHIIPNQSLGFLQYTFLDENRQEMDMKEKTDEMI